MGDQVGKVRRTKDRDRGERESERTSEREAREPTSGRPRTTRRSLSTAAGKGAPSWGGPFALSRVRHIDSHRVRKKPSGRSRTAHLRVIGLHPGRNGRAEAGFPAVVSSHASQCRGLPSRAVRPPLLPPAHRVAWRDGEVLKALADRASEGRLRNR